VERESSKWFLFERGVQAKKEWDISMIDKLVEVEAKPVSKIILFYSQLLW
jgi:hypothetical protein